MNATFQVLCLDILVENSRDLLRLNVGFIIHETIGFSREFELEFPSLHLEPDLDLKDFYGVVRVTRTAQGLLLQAKLQAKIDSVCVRCLTDFEQPVEAEFTELYAFSTNSVTESGLMVPENGKIELAPLVRDEMLLAVPINSLCRTDCKGLCPICGENLNETECHHEEETVDPRLTVLKSLLEKGETSSPDSE